MKNTIIAEKLEALENEVKSNIEKLLQQNIGENWIVALLGRSSLTFGIKDPTGERTCKFGQEVEVYFGEAHFGRKSGFKMNFGSTGAFSLNEEYDTVGRMNFYIGVGKLLENKLLLHQLEQMLNEYYNEWNNLFDQREK
jgi:hypothetical protein